MIRLAVRRPVATLTWWAALALLGLPTALRMPLDHLPDVTLPKLEISTWWPGASPEMVETLVTSPIEAVAHEVTGVSAVRSISSPHRSEVTVEFARATPMEFARLDLAERLAALAERLPGGATRPTVEPYVPEELAAEGDAFLVYALTGDAHPGALRDLAMREIKPGLLAIDGVDRVEVVGGSDRDLRVILAPERLGARGISLSEIRRAIAGGLNVIGGGASVLRFGREWTVAIDDRASGMEEILAFVVRAAREDTPAVRLGDLGTIEIGYADPAGYDRVDRRPAVWLHVHRQAGTNAIRLADRVREHAARIDLPPGHGLTLEHDGSRRIRGELQGLEARGLIAVAIALGVLFAAFRRWKPCIVALATMAVSALVALDLLHAAGLSLNLFTLAGFAMGLGLIIDNAIVVLEETERRAEAGEPPERAAMAGARSVALPMLASTATTLAALVPFLYLQGELRAYYLPFAVTVGATLAVSLAVSLTVVPAIVAMGWTRLASNHPARGEPLVLRGYRHLLALTVCRPRATTAAAFLLLVASAWVFWTRIPRGRAWDEAGESTRLQVRVTMPRGTEAEGTDALVRRFEERISAFAGVARVVTRVRGEFAEIKVEFPDSLEGTSVPLAIKERIAGESREFGGAEIRVYGFGPSFFGGGGAPSTYNLKILGYDYRELESIAEDLALRLKRLPRVSGVDANVDDTWFERDREIELVLAANRGRLAAHGLGVDDLLENLAPYTQRRIARDVAQLDGEEVGIEITLAGAERADVNDLERMVVTAPGGASVRVGEVSTIRPRETLRRIVRNDQRYQRVVAYQFQGPPKLGERLRDAVIATAALPPGFEIEDESTSWGEEGEGRRIALVLGLALALVFLVTAALYESLRAPLVVLAAVPLAGVGVVLLWWWTGRTFDREAWMGVIVMSGIVVNNAILVVHRIGALARGEDGPPLAVHAAALEGTQERVRPVLMTTATTVLGLLPFAFGAKEGIRTLWGTLSLVTIGGLVSSTMLVLVAIPALWLLLNGERDGRSGDKV